MKDVSEPKVFGPGAWLLMHTLAYFCEDIQTSLRITFKIYLYNLLCVVCQEHAYEFLSENPIEKAENLFEWTVDFHNHANRKTSKREFSYNEAKRSIVPNYLQPERFGPGIWIFFSVVSLKASNSYERTCIFKTLVYFINTVKGFKLQEWKEVREFNKFENNFKQACLTSADSYDLFKVIYEFHNRISIVLKKELLTYQQVLDIYDSKCEKNCGAH
jgi:hypothetical protein